MQYQDVESSNIKALAYTGETLGVRFKNGTEYHYQGVSLETFEQLIGAKSVGREFNVLIKSRSSDYPYERVA